MTQPRLAPEPTGAPLPGEDPVVVAMRARTDANRRFFQAEAPRVARLCHLMAERFARGGRLVALGASAQARSDVRHVAVEFVHPVIVGKRALPAIGLGPEGGPLAVQAGLVLRKDDIVLVFGLAEAGRRRGERASREGGTREALALALDRGCLTLAFAPSEAEWIFDPPTGSPFVRQELVETLYHVLWEHVHVFFDHRGLLEGRRERPTHDAGASSFLYPFLGEEERDLDGVLRDVEGSVLMKAEEVGALRERTLLGAQSELRAAAATMRAAFDGGRLLLALGNGGSATDAMDAVADLREPPAGWPGRAALDLTEDPGILTAIGNDVGMDEIFARQVIAYGDAEDVVLAFSTSGSSRNVVRALVEARRRGLRTTALVGCDGGRIRAEGLADHVILAPSEHIPRIQEAQASAWHVLRELVESAPAGTP